MAALLHAAAHPSNVGRIARVVRAGAELRLIYDASRKRIAIEVSHGPLSSPVSGWLMLWDASVADGALQNLAPGDVDFDSSVEYGLELMGFE
jgi:hypothetical protein